MPKPASYPTLYDECNKVSISFLKQHSYLQPNQYKAGVITWSRGDVKTGSISISCTTYNTPHIQLDYNSNGNPINYRVNLVAIPSNLGKGVVWYFICPHTGKRCRNLYLISGYFYHRKAFTGCMYEKQTESHQNRLTGKYYDKWRVMSKATDILGSKHFKTHYNGKRTKLFLKCLKQIDAGQYISLEALLIM